MNPSLPLLSENLQEFWSALKSTDPQSGHPIPLTANFAGNRIYDSRAGYGRLWSWFYSFLGFFFGDAIENQKLKAAIIHTHNIFQEQIIHFQPSLNCYHENLLKITQNKYSNPNTTESAKRNITEWNQASKPFVKLIHKFTHPITHEITHVSLKSLFDRLLETQQQETFTSSTNSHFISCQKVIDLENSVPSIQKYPLFSLKKISERKNLNKEEKSLVALWINKINVSQTPLKIVRNGINALVNTIWNDFNALQFLPSIVLQNYLEENGCKAYQEEEKLQERVLSIKKGSSIDFDDRTMIVDQPLQDVTIKDDLYLFSVENHPNRILIIGKNKSTLPIGMFRKQEKTNAQISDALFQRVSKNGLYGYVDDFILLKNYFWKNAPFGIDSIDMPKIQSIANFIKDCLKKNYSPCLLNQTPLFFNEKNHLTSVSFMPNSELDFHSLEDFAIEVSKGNEAVRKFLFKESGLIFHKTADFYHIVVDSVFENKNLDMILELAFLAISDVKVLQRGQEFKITLEERLKKEIERVQLEHDELQDPMTRQLAIECISKAYKDSLSISKLIF